MKFNKNLTTALIASFVLVAPAVLFAAGPATVNLGTAGNFTILAKTGISTTGSTSVVGDLGLSPAAASYITGFAPSLSSGSAFSTSSLVNGKIYAPGYADPTPASITTAVSNMETAYTDGAGRTNPTATELGAGNIGGMTLAPGLYKWSTGVTIPSDITLSGSANDVWIFQIAQNLNISSAKKVILSGGAQASNIFWVVAGQATIGTTAEFNGNILGQTAIVLNTGAKLTGRALAQTAVTLDSSSVTASSVVAPTPDPTPTPTSSSTNNSGSSSTSTNTTTSIDGGCSSGNKFNTSTGNMCMSSMPIANFGQQVRSIVTSMARGSHGDNVAILQQFLISQNKGPRAEALARFGANSHFGLLTKGALAEFQAKVGIKPALGNFGPITRAYLRANY